MNSKVIKGSMLVVLAAVMTLVIASSAGEALVKVAGKAAWYLPYVSIILAIRHFKAA